MKHRFLRLHDFHVVSDPGVKALPRQIQSFFSHSYISHGHVHLAAGGFHIEIRLEDVAFNPASEVIDLGASLRQRGIGLLDIAFRSTHVNCYAISVLGRYCIRTRLFLWPGCKPYSAT
jgi:hypothetical protein